MSERIGTQIVQECYRDEIIMFESPLHDEESHPIIAVVVVAVAAVVESQKVVIPIVEEDVVFNLHQTRLYIFMKGLDL